MTRLKLILALIAAPCMAGLASAADDPPAWLPAVDVAGAGLFSRREQISELSLDTLRWVKFTYVTGGSMPALYFQDSIAYPFHYPFAAAHIPEFAGYTADQYDRATLYNDGRLAYAGAVLVVERWINGTFHILAVALQVSAQEVIAKEALAGVLGTVRAALTMPDGIAVVYIPAYEQAAYAHDNRDWLAGQGIEVSSLLQWASKTAVYNNGWAIGRLVRVAAGDIDAAYRAGALTPSDILLTDAVPAEVPYVAGIVSEYPATQNSHVAILAGSWNVPFAYIHPEVMDTAPLLGKTVVLRGADLQLLDPEIDPALLESILSLKTVPQLDIRPMQPVVGTLWLSTEDLGPQDIDKVGGKAANYGVLRDAIPDSCRAAIALTFDLWNAFMDQPLPAYGRSLREEIAARLAQFPSYPPDHAAVQAALTGIRDLIRNQADFTPAQKAEIIAALAPFDPDRKIRFRSSTNVEDSDLFTGAGLYDSYSGCLLDDTDGDDAGPSLCDPAESGERGVFRAIRRVYASFYNDNAWLERLRHRVDETQAGMGVLVHHSFPDEYELANGVAVYDPNPGGTPKVTIVTQKGAVSVTNPAGDAIPEVVTATLWRNLEPSYFIQQASNLLILGEKSVMDWDADYAELGRLMTAVAARWIQVRPDLAGRRLDFEFKKLAPAGQVVLTQVRPLVPEPGASTRRFLLAGSHRLRIFQGEHSDPLSLHRAKSAWTLSVPSMELAAAPQQSFHGPAEYRFPGADAIQTWTGAPRDWPDAKFSTAADEYGRLVCRDTWKQTIAGVAATRTLEATLPAPGAIPLLYVSDFTYQLVTEYAEQPAPSVFWTPQIAPLPVLPPYTETVWLTPAPAEDTPGPYDIPVRRATAWLGVTIETSFYWPPEPNGFTAGFTAPLQAWKETRISGLTSDPIVLTSPFSQTYRPGHHNFNEWFILEPALDPDVPQVLKDELAAGGIRYIGVRARFQQGGINYAGPGEDLRDPIERWLGKVTLLYSGGYESAWMGGLDARQFPWILHATLGWIHVHGPGPDNLWLWFNDGHGWLWTTQEIYPFFYSAAEAGWLYYLKGTRNPTWWYHYNSGKWEATPSS